MPTGTEAFEIRDIFETSEGWFSLTQLVGPSGTSTITDGQGNTHIISPVTQPKLDAGLDEIFHAPPGGSLDAMRITYSNTLGDSYMLGVLIPETALAVASLFLDGGRP